MIAVMIGNKNRMSFVISIIFWGGVTVVGTVVGTVVVVGAVVVQ